MAKTEQQKFSRESLIVKPKEKRPLSRIPTKLPELYTSDDDFDEQMDSLRSVLSERQEILYADARHGLLVIFQGLDASGKDGAIKHVMTGFNPQGVAVTTFRAPSEEERRHDFLWRAHARIPVRGMIGIFNRSYYEEIVTVRVHPEFLESQKLPGISKNVFHERSADIVNFESYLTREGYKIIKFYLHLSKDEQRERLLKRITTPDKNWKFDPSDMRDRANWSRYQNAYNEGLSLTSTRQAPWYVIPADDKKNARLMISRILLEEFNSIHLSWPKVTPQLKREIARAQRALAPRKGRH